MNNVYNEIEVTPGEPTIINAIVVPERGGYSFKGLVAWCNFNCDIQIKINTETIGGGKISWANQTLVLDFAASPYGLDAKDILTVCATLCGDTQQKLYSTLLVEQL